MRAALAGEAPDILFIDTILPDTDGRTITAWREGKGARSVVVLVADLLSARWSGVARVLDAYDVLLKPLSPRNVGHVLQAAAVLCRELTLLLVEPGHRTRVLARQMLETTTFRFRVSEAMDGKTAVRLAKEQTKQQAADGGAAGFDLAILGSSIPDMPVSEAACRLDALGAGTRIVIAGGAAEEPSAAQLALFGAKAFLRMPFDAADLDRLVYETFGLWRPYVLEALRSESLRLDAERLAAAVPKRITLL